MRKRAVGRGRAQIACSKMASSKRACTGVASVSYGPPVRNTKFFQKLSSCDEEEDNRNIEYEDRISASCDNDVHLV